MTADRSVEYLVSLIQEFVKLPKETEWLEFKINNADPEEIGENISGLANSAALCGKSSAYLVWGIKDDTHEVVGTSFVFTQTKQGNEEIENWLLRMLSPKIHIRVYEFKINGSPVVMLEIPRASQQPVQFQGQEFIRVGSYTKKLKEYPEKERELWRIFDKRPFEQLIAADEVTADDVLQRLNYPAYFQLLKLPLPEGRQGILQALSADEMIAKTSSGRWNVTNLGAILFARALDDFHSLKRKAVRVIAYKGNDRVEGARERVGSKGYAVGFGGLIDYVKGFLPENEEIKKAMRKTVPMYPELAVRELVANALIHQDFFITGGGPMIEIFENRMEVSNPGKPLVKTDRFLDAPPRSRNELLASFMRRIGICEERGSGVDKVVFQTEFYQLPAPVFEEAGDNTRAILFAKRALSKMDKNDRIRACYFHACLKYVNQDYMTNTSLRERLGINPQNKAMASRYIKEALEANVISPHDKTAPPKLRKYVPIWAKR